MNLWGGGRVQNSVPNREHVNFAHGKSGEVYLNLGVREGFPCLLDKTMDIGKSQPCFRNVK